MNEIKKQLRKIMLERQRNLSESYIIAASESIAGQLLSCEHYQKSEKIFIYVSTAREPDTLAIINDALNNNKKVYIPKCVNKEMYAVRINDMKNLIVGGLGILEPAEAPLQGDYSGNITAGELDIIIAPCLSASLDGKRLGHGMGYYDKFLSNSKSHTVCLCFGKMLCDKIPMNENDVYMSDVITENF